MHTFLVFSKVAEGYRAESDESGLDALKKAAVDAFNREIKRLEVWAEIQECLGGKRREYATVAALVPAQGTVEKLVRYEAHLSREFDRTLNQLERCQRMRMGQPVMPAIKVELSS